MAIALNFKGETYFVPDDIVLQFKEAVDAGNTFGLGQDHLESGNVLEAQKAFVRFLQEKLNLPRGDTTDDLGFQSVGFDVWNSGDKGFRDLGQLLNEGNVRLELGKGLIEVLTGETPIIHDSGPGSQGQSGGQSVDPNLPTGLIKFDTPSGSVFGVNEGGKIRAATGDEAVQAATGQAQFATVKSKTNQPFSEFMINTPSSGATSSGSTGSTASPTATSTASSTQGSSQTSGTVDLTPLFNSAEFQALNADEQEAIKSVFNAIAENDAEAAKRLESAFRAATKISNPFFAQQIRLAADALERGYVSIGDEAAFKEQQLRNALNDLEEDVANQQEFLTLEEQNVLRGIERQYKQTLKNTQQNLAATGFTSSTRRAETEQLLADERGDLVESTERKFAFQKGEAGRELARGTRDIQAEVERLTRLAEEGQLDLLRRGEAQLGTKNLPQLSGAPSPLGGITGSIEQEKQRDIISGVKNLVF